jgi:endogenous inhibitor of DNA gyrase (YacG/DUF329 family)
MNKPQYAVKCPYCGVVPITDAEYQDQVDFPDDGWYCPRCLNDAEWSGDDDLDDLDEEAYDIPFF